MTVIELLAAFALIVGGAVGFTNAVEWLGHRLNLTEGAVGALLAAVGTALPESIIPVVALINGGGDEESVQVAIGAIIGAPFVLGTLAMVIVAVSAHVFAGRREQGTTVTGERGAIRRDLGWFLAMFPVAIVLGVLDVPAGVRYAAAAGFVIALRRLRVAHGHGRRGGGGRGRARAAVLRPVEERSAVDAPDLAPVRRLAGARSSAAPSCSSTSSRTSPPRSASPRSSSRSCSRRSPPSSRRRPTASSGSARARIRWRWATSPGAMVFQASVPVSLGLLLTDWQLERQAVVAAAIGVAGGALARWALPRGTVGIAPTAVWAALFTGFVAYAAVS